MPPLGRPILAPFWGTALAKGFRPFDRVSLSREGFVLIEEFHLGIMVPPVRQGFATSEGFRLPGIVPLFGGVGRLVARDLTIHSGLVSSWDEVTTWLFWAMWPPTVVSPTVLDPRSCARFLNLFAVLCPS